jgi:hypothetical protein
MVTAGLKVWRVRADILVVLLCGRVFDNSFANFWQAIGFLASMVRVNRASNMLPRPRRTMRQSFQKQTIAAVFFLAAVSLGFSAKAYAASPSISEISLDHGFRLLYDLDFVHAHEVFSSWQQQHPDDPLGPVSDAAGLLFSEFDRLGVLESQFYTTDQAFDERKKVNPDPALRDKFNVQLGVAEDRARARLTKNAQDSDALFAMTLASGLRADYAALIEKRNLASLHYTKDATHWADQLLAVDPKCYDAHVATGFSKYIIGSMAAPVRWLLRFGGVDGDKTAGIAELQITAEHGRFLAPFARILLAIAYVREKDKPQARGILAALRDEFPRNPLFAREIARLDSAPEPSRN